MLSEVIDFFSLAYLDAATLMKAELSELPSSTAELLAICSLSCSLYSVN